MQTIIDQIDLSAYNCDFIDIRLEEISKTNLTLKNGELEQGNQVPAVGAFIRVRQNDKWYYSSTTEIDLLHKNIVELVASTGVEEPLRSAQNVSYSFEKKELLTPDLLVFKSIKEKLNLILPLKEVFKREKNVILSSISYIDTITRRWYKNSEGKSYYYDKDLVGVNTYYVLKDGEDIFNTSFSKTGHYDADFDNFTEELYNDIQEARLFVKAPTITPGKYPVILSEEAAGIFAHESFGHKSEADFMIGDETMKKEWEMGKKVGSDILSIVDEGDIPGTSGYMPFDDEGNAKQKTYLIKNGLLTGRLHSSHTAEVLEEEPTGNARAMNFFYEPIVRMTNTYIEAGEVTFEELCAPIQNGFYIGKVSHGSGMSTFTLAINRAWHIKDGHLAEPVKVNVITGTVFQTLNDIDGLSNELKILSFAGGGCGKMEQWPLPVGFGGPKVRIREMMVS